MIDLLRVVTRVLVVFALGLIFILGGGILPTLMYGRSFLSQELFTFLYVILIAVACSVGVLSTFTWAEDVSPPHREVRVYIPPNPQKRKPRRRKEVQKEEPPQFPKTDSEEFLPAEAK